MFRRLVPQGGGVLNCLLALRRLNIDHASFSRRAALFGRTVSDLWPVPTASIYCHIYCQCLLPISTCCIYWQHLPPVSTANITLLYLLAASTASIYCHIYYQYILRYLLPVSTTNINWLYLLAVHWSCTSLLAERGARIPEY